MGSRFLALTAVVVLSLLSVAPPTIAQDGGDAGPPGECDLATRVGGIDPPHAQGTTFVGTYRGDALLGDARTLLTSWDVERVYAGGPIPRDLVFQTPSCAWTNLTPGVRYLFSTAVTDLDPQRPDAGQPSAADSLAWELLADGLVRLAPFDTALASDYTSEELGAISSFEDALWSVAPDGGEGTEPAAPVDPAYGCLASWSTASPDQAQGTTFTGLYIGEQQLPGPIDDDVREVWAVERVYAGGLLPEVLTLRSQGCAPTTLEAGHRYLFSTADPLAPAAWNSLAWELGDEGRVDLAPFASLGAADYPAAARDIVRLQDALSAVAPEATEGETPLRAGDRTPG